MWPSCDLIFYNLDTLILYIVGHFRCTFDTFFFCILSWFSAFRMEDLSERVAEDRALLQAWQMLQRNRNPNLAAALPDANSAKQHAFKWLGALWLGPEERGKACISFWSITKPELHTMCKSCKQHFMESPGESWRLNHLPLTYEMMAWASSMFHSLLRESHLNISSLNSLDLVYFS